MLFAPRNLYPPKVFGPFNQDYYLYPGALGWYITVCVHYFLPFSCEILDDFSLEELVTLKHPIKSGRVLSTNSKRHIDL